MAAHQQFPVYVKYSKDGDLDLGP